MRRKFKTPREAMEAIATLWDVPLQPGLDDVEKMPGASMAIALNRSDSSWDAEAEAMAEPRLRCVPGLNEGKPYIEIEIQVVWPTNHHDAANAVVAARVHTMVADLAARAESMIRKQTWDPAEILNTELVNGEDDDAED